MKDSTQNYSIGVVTYHARFESYFKPLVQKLVSIFPDKDIICVINGHPDRSLQMRYFKKVVSFLKQYPTVRYLTYDTNQSLSKCWNQLIILSDSPRVLILNDDTDVSELFRSELDTHMKTPGSFTLNKSWSHFIIAKDTIKRVGWFDERFLGVGQEDGDYAYRMTMNDTVMQDKMCTGLRNYVAEQKNPGWIDISKTTNNTRYADINKDFFNKKWLTPSNSPEINQFDYTCVFNDTSFPFSLAPGMDTPCFYDVSILDETNNIHPLAQYISSPVKIRLQGMYFHTGRLLARLWRSLKR